MSYMIEFPGDIAGVIVDDAEGIGRWVETYGSCTITALNRLPLNRPAVRVSGELTAIGWIADTVATPLFRFMNPTTPVVDGVLAAAVATRYHDNDIDPDDTYTGTAGDDRAYWMAFALKSAVRDVGLIMDHDCHLYPTALYQIT